MLQGIAQDIETLLSAYLQVRSDSGTAQENNADGFFRDCLADEPYFRENPGHRGAFPIPADPLGRSINWALARGEGPGTVVLIHHSDTVGTEDYQNLAGCARDPRALAEALGRPSVELSPEARQDLESGEFLFGHGAADMKAGGAIQLALLRRFSRQSRRAGSLLLLALPDEENLSLGMRHSPLLLESLPAGVQHIEEQGYVPYRNVQVFRDFLVLHALQMQNIHHDGEVGIVHLPR